MATLSVLKFNDPGGADRVLLALQGLQEQQMITLEDAAVVSWPQGKKRPLVPQGHEMPGYGALGGAFWGFLFGLIFFVPFLGAAAGAGAGAALLGSLDKGGIDEQFIKEVGEKVTEGTSALFVLTSGAPDRERVMAELKQYDFEIIWTNLPEEQLQQLLEVFAQQQREPTVRTFEDMRLETKCGESPILIGEGIDRSRLHGLREPQGLGIILGAVRQILADVAEAVHQQRRVQQ